MSGKPDVAPGKYDSTTETNGPHGSGKGSETAMVAMIRKRQQSAILVPQTQSQLDAEDQAQSSDVPKPE